jgi:hypothetical protein
LDLVQRLKLSRELFDLLVKARKSSFDYIRRKKTRPSQKREQFFLAEDHFSDYVSQGLWCT